tara:strand:+ start:11161 stop:13215 length:2055 start_codon:yes stop_codon:yes gene_type:complete
MTFLSPTNLWLLTFLTIPIAIHFLNRSKNQEVKFSSIKLILGLKTTALRRVELQKLILLILRILGIICLVLVFSQPVTKGFLPGWIAAEQEARLFIIIDNSASMSAKENGKTFLEQSKNEAVALLPHFKKDALISIVQTCPPRTIFKGYSNDPSLKKTVKSISQTSSYDDIWNNIIIFLNNKLIFEPIKECVVFSDLMHSPDSLFKESIDNYNDWKFYFIQPPELKNNVTIKNVIFENRINTLNQLTKVNARIQNNGVSPEENFPVELLFNDQRVGQVISEFSSGKEKDFLFQAYPTKEGVMQSRVTIPSDSYSFDNIWHHTTPVMSQINCGIIGANKEDIRILEMILKSIDPYDEFLKIESRIQPNLNRLFLDDLDMIFIHNSSGMSKESVADLEKFLKNGGGLIWFDGNEKSNSQHEDLYKMIDFPNPLSKMSAGQGFFSTKIINKESDLIKNIQVRNINAELPQVFNYIKTKTNDQHVIHWELNNGDPLLLEFSKGRGDIFYFTTILDLQWNDLPIRGIIIPLIYKLLILTGTDEINTASVLIDNPKWIPLRESKLGNKLEVISPSGQKQIIVPDYDLEGVSITNTNELGIYKVFSNGEHLTSFPTRLHPAEYLSQKISQPDLDGIISENQSKWLDMNRDLTQLFAEVRHGKTLWKFFLCFAIFFFLLETLLGIPQTKNLK